MLTMSAKLKPFGAKQIFPVHCILELNGKGSGRWVFPFSGANRTSRMAKVLAFISASGLPQKSFMFKANPRQIDSTCPVPGRGGGAHQANFKPSTRIYAEAEVHVDNEPRKCKCLHVTLSQCITW